jgi:hypothetical protein
VVGLSVVVTSAAAELGRSAAKADPMVGRDQAAAIALKLAVDDPPSPYRKVERVSDVFSMDRGQSWTVHLVPEPLDLGDGTFAFNTLGVWIVVVCGRTGRCNWVETL